MGKSASFRGWVTAAVFAAVTVRSALAFDAVRGSVPARIEFGSGVTETLRRYWRSFPVMDKDDLLGMKGE